MLIDTLKLIRDQSLTSTLAICGSNAIRAPLEWLGHESLDVTLAYLKGSDAASEPVQEQVANGALAACV